MDDLLQRLVSLVETRWALKCASIEPIKVRENAVYAVHLRDGGKVTECLFAEEVRDARAPEI